MSTFLFALPNDNTLDPSSSVPAGLRFTFVFPFACRIASAHLHGHAATLGSTNTLAVGGTPQPTNLDLYINGAKAETLLTLPAGITDTDLFGASDIPIPANAEVQFILPIDSNASGVLDNFLFAFSLGAL